MQQSTVPQEEWLRVLTKGMITIPKAWRDEFGIQEGKLVLAKKKANEIVIQPIQKSLPYRVYSQEELDCFVKDDRLTPQLAKKVSRLLSKTKQ